MSDTNASLPKLDKFSVDSTSNGGYDVQAVFQHDSTTILAGLAAEILSSQAAPNYFTADVTHDEAGRFSVSVEKWGGKSALQGITEECIKLRNSLAAMTEDRDLWKGDHDGDCPYKDRAESAEAERDALKAKLNKAVDLLKEFYDDVGESARATWARPTCIEVDALLAASSETATATNQAKGDM